ncbi:MAG TPA: hypothetical protein VGC84_10450 [Ilumatobacteraceae bacterium]
MAAALIVTPMVSNEEATASCVAPSVTFKPAKVARGGVLSITGRYFGDDCADTGTLPGGVGPLGHPLTGLTIVIDQGSLEFPVAAGSAGADYAFKVDVVVPSGLAPGEASLNVLGAGDARLTITPPLVITSNAPPGTDKSAVATFGSPPPTDTEPDGSLPPVPIPAEIPDVPLATAPPLSAAPIDDGIGRSTDLQKAIAVGVAGLVAIGATIFGVWTRAKRRGW